MRSHEPNRFPKIGRFSTLPATWIDEIYTHDRKNIFYSLAYSLLIRFIYVFIFIPLVVVDLVMATGAWIGKAIKSLFTRDPEKSKKLKAERSELVDIIRNSVVVTLFGIFGIFSPKFVIKYFTPNENELYDNAENKLQADQLLSPNNTDDLMNGIIHANVNDIKLIVSTDTHMEGLEPNEKVLNLSHFNTIEISDDKKTVRVGAGVRWFDLQKALNQEKLALEVMHENESDTIADAIAINSHSHLYKNGRVATGVTQMNVMNTSGRLVRVTPSDDLFKIVAGGQHLFGVVTHVTFKVVPNNLLQRSAQLVSLQDYIEYFKKEVKNDKKIVSHQYELAIDPFNLFHTGVAINYREMTSIPVVSELKEQTSKHQRDSLFENLAKSNKLSRGLYSAAEAHHSLRVKSENVSRNNLMRMSGKLKSNELLSESVWLQEYYIPENKFEQFMESLAEILKKNQVRLLKASVSGYRSEENVSLNPAIKGDALAISIQFNQQLNPKALLQVDAWLAQIQGVVLTMGGTYKLQDQITPALGTYRTANKRFDDVFDRKRMSDPKGTFSNSIFKKIQQLLSLEKSNPVLAVNASQKSRKHDNVEASASSSSSSHQAATVRVYGDKGLGDACTQFATLASERAVDEANKDAARRAKKEEGKKKRKGGLRGGGH